MRDITDRVDDRNGTDALTGTLTWAPVKSLFYIGNFISWATLGTIYFSWSAVAVFFALSIIIICGGHSLGFHRKMIHDSFECPLWLSRLGMYLGTLVGLGGPFTMMRAHDLRDWAQRQDKCHPFFSQHSSIGRDWWYQNFLQLKLSDGPQMRYPDTLTKDPVILWLQRTVYLQHAIIGLALLLIGGWGWVAWGLCGRIFISITGHWLVGWFAHNHGPQDYIVPKVGVQGHNVPGPVGMMGLITFGECWHNNHHAFPESAKLGLQKGQLDPGWWVLCLFAKFGWVSAPILPDALPKTRIFRPADIR